MKRMYHITLKSKSEWIIVDEATFIALCNANEINRRNDVSVHDGMWSLSANCDDLYNAAMNANIESAYKQAMRREYQRTKYEQQAKLEREQVCE